ncbi:MAG: hypothetical protein LBU35_02580 [Holosporales bacterium]|jgi:hypothetical protein|nr:hypothetical protein [Holosporales bacterium]
MKSLSKVLLLSCVICAFDANALEDILRSYYAEHINSIGGVPWTTLRNGDLATPSVENIGNLFCDMYEGDHLGASLANSNAKVEGLTKRCISPTNYSWDASILTPDYKNYIVLSNLFPKVLQKLRNNESVNIRGFLTNENRQRENAILKNCLSDGDFATAMNDLAIYFDGLRLIDFCQKVVDWERIESASVLRGVITTSLDSQNLASFQENLAKAFVRAKKTPALNHLNQRPADYRLDIDFLQGVFGDDGHGDLISKIVASAAFSNSANHDFWESLLKSIATDLWKISTQSSNQGLLNVAGRSFYEYVKLMRDNGKLTSANCQEFQDICSVLFDRRPSSDPRSPTKPSYFNSFQSRPEMQRLIIMLNNMFLSTPCKEGFLAKARAAYPGLFAEYQISDRLQDVSDFSSIYLPQTSQAIFAQLRMTNPEASYKDSAIFQAWNAARVRKDPKEILLSFSGNAGLEAAFAFQIQPRGQQPLKLSNFIRWDQTNIKFDFPDFRAIYDQTAQANGFLKPELNVKVLPNSPIRDEIYRHHDLLAPTIDNYNLSRETEFQRIFKDNCRGDFASSGLLGELVVDEILSYEERYQYLENVGLTDGSDGYANLLDISQLISAESYTPLVPVQGMNWSIADLAHQIFDWDYDLNPSLKPSWAGLDELINRPVFTLDLEQGIRISQQSYDTFKAAHPEQSANLFELLSLLSNANYYLEHFKAIH